MLQFRLADVQELTLVEVFECVEWYLAEHLIHGGGPNLLRLPDLGLMELRAFVYDSLRVENIQEQLLVAKGHALLVLVERGAR